MPTSKNDAESFLDKLQETLNNLTEVRVITAVGSVPVRIATTGGATSIDITDGEAVNAAIVTVIKLLDGDVTTIIADSLVDNAELRAMHTAQVAASLEVIPTHLKTLADLAHSLLT
jgi:hypothetical protein